MNRDVLSWVTFLSVLSLIIFAVNFYIGYRLTGVFAPGSPWRVALWSVIILFAGLVLVAPMLRMIGPKIPESFARTIVFMGYSHLGLMAVMVFILMALDILLFTTGLSFTPDVISPERRTFLFNYGPWAAIGVTGLLSVKGYQTADNGPRVMPVTIKKENLAEGLKGLKIAQISDLHVSSTIKKDYVENVVAKTMAEKPDMIMLTGDMVDGSYHSLKEDVDPLRKLSAPMGVYYITGNHEYYWGHEDWEKVFSDFGFKILHNRHEVTEKNGAKVVVAGVPDFTYESFKLGKVDALKALEGAPKNDFTVFLVHQPEGYKLIENIPCDLQLSGHTHAGQFFPPSLFISLFHKYAKGLYRHKDKFWVYVNPGTGYWGPINRLGVPSEITVFTLQA